MLQSLRYLAIVGVLGFLAYNFFGGGSTDYVEDDLDLNQVLDVTVETIYAFEEKHPEEFPDGDAAFVQFSEDLTENYNAAMPAIYKEPITVQPQEDASLLAFVDKDGNKEFDSNSEEALYMVEIDGENSRVIATSRSGAINDYRISGAGLLTGMLIGSMLSRQRAAGANPASKKTRTARQAARSRAGSGSHSRGK